MCDINAGLCILQLRVPMAWADGFITTCSEPASLTTIEQHSKRLSRLKVVNYFHKISTLDIWLGSECDSALDHTTQGATKTSL